MDQTEIHTESIERQLSGWHKSGQVNWVRLSTPSITGAMNRGLLEASGEIVLFLDDDIIPGLGLVAAHAANYMDEAVLAVVGQVLQPGETPQKRTTSDRGKGIWRDLNYLFCSSLAGSVENCMAGNLSVRKHVAIAVGGMDESFQGVAYRFETEFARRLVAFTAKPIRYDPKAGIRHLQSPSGGTRTQGSHLTSSSPLHSVGDYYFAFLQSKGLERYSYMIYRLYRSLRTRFHLTHAWWIPARLLGEVRGYSLAKKLYRSPQMLIQPLPKRGPDSKSIV